MQRLFAGLLRGLVLRCPRCGQGRILRSYFVVAERCMVCGLEYEPAAGEVTGAMGINLVLTLVIALAAAVIIGFSRTLPVWPSVLAMVVVIVAFPIACYPISRGLWIAVLYLTGNDRAERG